eukprot:CAMPEP_0174313074 /NCGR_PEP_ID=MMETSP0810-20121108/4731_1 /TAXON_ID=73025 ORGANISM="Eutreptiella gymnastica-like, Strain CCMP1594" /NCGR_SAMPLE_ID=MMETSP0810 /ASSEMBLY_ACC=CAM_ASM_000659 /LENGTH=105 /DNA_ID=CAMNT_0015421713 /DNA_START=826 /DNA_END=1143 /DNA_ORIENTATION=-
MTVRLPLGAFVECLSSVGSSDLMFNPATATEPNPATATGPVYFVARSQPKQNFPGNDKKIVRKASASTSEGLGNNVRCDAAACRQPLHWEAGSTRPYHANLTLPF